MAAPPSGPTDSANGTAAAPATSGAVRPRQPEEPTQTVIELPRRAGRSAGLRLQVLLGLAVVALFAVISTGALSLWAAADSLRQQREATAAALAAAGASAVSASLDPDLPLAPRAQGDRLVPLVRQLLEAGNLAEVSILDREQQVVVARPPRDPRDQDPPVALAALSGVPSVLHYRTGAVGVTQLLAYAPVTLPSGQVAGLVRVVMEAPPPMLGFLAKSGSMLVGLALGNAVLLVALGYLLITASVVRPLRQVEKATAALAAGHLEQPIRVEGPRELLSLSESFNRMAESLASQREQLIRTEKLASVGQLAAGVAHEIGNPLAAILGYADLLKGDAEAQSLPNAAGGSLDPAERLLIASRIKSETQRIHRTIADLLEYSRPGQDAPGATDVLVVVKAAQNLVQAMGSRAGQVVFRVQDADRPEAWPVVKASAERLEQVFVNLLLNAADAMRGEGEIRIAAEVRAPNLEVKVEDSGPGVPAELRRRIFDPFFTTKDPGKGTGLGLPICRSIIEAAGGSLELLPGSAGRGAAFLLTLPLA